MKLLSVTSAVLVCLTTVYPVFARTAGNAGTFTRGGWAGAEYIATGSAAEASADDVYALYWNPAGLASLSRRGTTTPDDIRKKAAAGDATGITDDDLLRFSETRDSFFVQVGASATQLDLGREAVFGGAAFKCFGGVAGAGAMSVYSGGIDTYDENAVRTGQTSYSATVGYLSYARSFGVSSFGVTIKPIYEKIADASYSGGSFDLGAQAEILPFIKAGCVFQDGVLGEYPTGGKDLERKWHQGSPMLRFSMAIDSRSADFSLMGGCAYKMEQQKFVFNAGFRYGVGENISVALGLSGAKFRAGLGCRVWGCELWYAFSVDSINAGYDNTVSLSMMW